LFTRSTTNAAVSTIKNIKIEVRNGVQQNTTKAFPVTYADDKSGSVNPEIKILTGENKLRFFDADDPENLKNQISLTVTCTSGCAKDFSNITINQPAEGDVVTDKPTIDSRIVIQKASNITKVRIRVTDTNGNDVDDELNKAPIPLSYKEGATTAELNRQIRVLEGDRVSVVLSPYDLTRGRVIYRHK